MTELPSHNGLDPAVPPRPSPRPRPSDLDELVPLAYDDLHALAEHLLRRRVGVKPRATSLIHEVYVRLAARGPMPFESKSHFLHTAARAMRYVLVDQERRRREARRGDGRAPIRLDDGIPAEPSNPDLIAIDEALERLTRLDPDKASVVELRFFGGLTIQETAAVLGVSTATVKRDWALARAWLFRELTNDLHGAPGDRARRAAGS